ncbi:YegP family protein [Aquimarina aquimarini]|uniref:YegP family protein n=1 Tax=Aquimarina aquimarini TaxID=1191734 RepID=UPI000D5519E9|nr:YegP family protein [Aquimarina aquimarini]
MGKFLIRQMRNGQYYFNLKAVNGEVILSSEGYTSIQGCRNGVQSVKRNSINDSSYIRKIASNGKHYFYLKAQNGEIIGTSEMYSSRQSMENGVESVKRNAPNASIN